MTYECGTILNTCVLSLVASLGAIVTALVALIKAKRVEVKKDG